MLVIDAAAVRELFPMRAAIEQMREALERYSAATIVQPLRTVVRPSRAPGMMAALDARDLAIVGAGTQARSHLEAMASVRRLERIRVWSRTDAHAKALAEWAGDRFGPPVEVRESVADALDGADLVCTVLSCVEPVVSGGMLARGAHVNAVGACLPHVRELSTDAVAAATVFADSRESALAEAGDLVIPIRAGELAKDHVVAEIGEVLLPRRATRGDQGGPAHRLGGQHGPGRRLDGAPPRRAVLGGGALHRARRQAGAHRRARRRHHPGH